MTSEEAQHLFGPGFDVELRTYQLLALEQRASRKMLEQEIFPLLAELTQWNQTLRLFIESKSLFEKSLKTDLDELDLDNTRVTYTAPAFAPNQQLEEMSEWAVAALEKTTRLVEEFTALKNDLLSTMESEPVGLLPLYRDEGYLLITHGNDTDVFKYQRKMVFESSSSTRHISSDYFSTYEVSAVNTPQNIKLSLIKTCREIPNPATWSFYSQQALPLAGTLLPLAKEKLRTIIDR